MRLLLSLFACGFLCSISINALAQSHESSEAERAYYVLTRLGYGPAGNDVQRVAQMGVDNYIEQQLHPESIELPDSLTQQLGQLPTLKESSVELFLQERELKEQRKDAAGDDKKGIGQQINAPVREARDARLLNAIESPRQLQEVLVDFWFNHFNVYSQKELDRIFVGDYENRAIRPYVLGKFRDMLEATAKHPAMLYYLDNWKNVAPSNKPLAPDKNGKPKEEGINENYAREVMELHTLGVNGGYTQTDVTELARIFSGWGFGGAKQQRPQRGSRFAGFMNDDTQKGQVEARNHAAFYFNADHHDFGQKKFLGRIFQGSGQAEGETALDMLAYSPVTARHVSYELAQYFVADTPPDSLVETMTSVWMRTNGDLRAVTTAMIAAPEFWDARYRGDKYRTPLQYVVAAVRASSAPVDVEVLNQSLAKLGEEIYGCLTPDGFKNTLDAWLNTAGTENRLTFATGLGSGKLEQIHVQRDTDGVAEKLNDDGKPVPLDPKRIETTLDNFFAPSTLAAVEAADPNLQAALLLGSPEMMRR